MKACESSNCTTSLVSDDRMLAESPEPISPEERSLSFIGDIEKGPHFLAKTYMKACESGNCTTSLVSDDRMLAESPEPISPEVARSLSFIGDIEKGLHFLAKTYMKACESGNCPTSLVSDDRMLAESPEPISPETR